MTKLYIHIGTEKTGSSFVQKVCGHNRELLKRQGYWFPIAGKHESRLISGTISPGNAVELSQHIFSGDWESVARWMNRRASEASERDCQRLLLSNEVLFAALSESNAVSRFLSASRHGGVEDVEALLFIRDPVDQALSLYKHRAKSGRMPAVQEWLESSFELPLQVRSFLSQADAVDVNLTIRKYVRDSASMMRMFFSEWLGFNDDLHVPEAIVNPSLTLSELRVLNHVAGNRPELVAFFYDEFMSVSASDKARGDGLEVVARETISQYLSQYESLWQDLDRRLASDGGLALPVPGNGGTLQRPDYCLSDAQLEAVATACDRYLAPRNQLIKLTERKLLRPAKRLLSRLAGRHPNP